MNSTMSKISAMTNRARQGAHGGRLGNYYVINSPDGSETLVNYRGTDVARFNRFNGTESVTLNDGGWHTPTTKNVMNAALAYTRFWVYQEQWDWFIGDTQTGASIPYRRGITLDLSINVTDQERSAA